MGDLASVTPALRRQRRRWLFSRMVFDEASWTLVVEGRQVDIETKPLEVLRELLLRPGEVVTKGELLDAVWPMVTVVEASLTTAVRKLRRAFGSANGEESIIETVSGLGYRLAVPVELEFRPVQMPGSPEAQAEMPSAGGPDRSYDHDTAVRSPRRPWPARKWSMAGALALALLGGGVVAARMSLGASPTAPPRVSQADAKDALRALDLPRVETMLRQGWNPNTPFDAEGNGALNEVLNVCAWNPGHDKQKLLLVARTLYDAGARIDVRNVWGDTPYSIAAAKRYCGPDHPVTQMLREECYTGYNPLGDKCLAKYAAKR